MNQVLEILSNPVVMGALLALAGYVVAKTTTKYDDMVLEFLKKLLPAFIKKDEDKK